MQIKNFPYCCTIQIMCDFGETVTSEGGATEVTVESIKEYIELQLSNTMNNRLAMFVATTNNQQKKANQALRACGFKSTKWATKGQHPETKVKLWWYPIHDD